MNATFEGSVTSLENHDAVTQSAMPDVRKTAARLPGKHSVCSMRDGSVTVRELASGWADQRDSALLQEERGAESRAELERLRIEQAAS